MSGPAAGRWKLAAVVLLALLLHAPSLRWGFFADDYGQQIVLRGLAEHPTMRPWSLYDFGSLASMAELQAETGALPFWTSPAWSVRFFRPIASSSLALDHALFGGWAPGYHLSGLVLFALLLAAAHALYRALDLPPRAALLAVAVLGLEDGTVLPVGWPANRNGLVEALFTTLALLVLVRGARAGRRASVGAALALAAAAVLAKESGLGALALAGFFLLRPPAGAGEGLSRRVRAGSAAAAGLLAGAYLAFFLAAGYGAASVFYPLPWSAPLAFAGRLAVLGPVGAAAMLTPIPSDLFVLYPAFAGPAAFAA
ncbi:MAG: hypothetical protein AB1726_13655, partial [Planctomycetota bacterium]